MPMTVQEVKKLKGSSLRVFHFAALTLLTAACSNATFSPSGTVATPATSGGNTQTVTPAPVVTPGPANPTCTPTSATTRMTKVLFLVDTSSSNAEWIDMSTDYTCPTGHTVGCTPPTDPNKIFRKGSIQNFLNQYASKSNFQWSFVTFANDATQDFVANNGGPSFTANPSVMQSALNSFAQYQDNGDTPYGLALSAATQAIANDPDRNTAANPQYFVVLLTDGFPTDFSSPSDAAPYVNSLLAAAPNVTLSTVFYGAQGYPSTASALAMLQGMATLGNGQFANVNNPSSGININSVIPGTTCP